MIPPEYFTLSLRDVLALARLPTEKACDVETLTHAIQRLDQTIAAEDAAREQRDREWLEQHLSVQGGD